MIYWAKLKITQSDLLMSCPDNREATLIDSNHHESRLLGDMSKRAFLNLVSGERTGIILVNGLTQE